MVQTYCSVEGRKDLHATDDRPGMAQSRRSLLAVLAAASSGCVSPSTDPNPSGMDAGQPHPAESETDGPTATESTTAEPTGTPDYATCDRSAVMTPPSDGYRSPPTDLTSERVGEYVMALEKDIVLPAEDERTDGWIDLKSPTVESVAHGYIVYLPVRGGYYNEKVDYSTATQHADLSKYTASYFVTERVVRRARGSDRIDPRKSGEVVVCQVE